MSKGRGENKERNQSEKAGRGSREEIERKNNE